MRNVITGDGNHEKIQSIELKEVDYGKESRWFIGDTEFDGHTTLWGFDYFPTTYLTSSYLSGDEYRKGGVIRYYRDRKICFEETCREPINAILKVAGTLQKLMDFDFEHHFVLGRKVWYRDTPAIITMLIPEQGCVILETEDKKPFPNPAWHNKEIWGNDLEDSVKVEILDNNVHWFRD